MSDEEENGVVELEPLDMAATVLVSAQEKAELLNDVDALMKIAGGWMELHEFINGEQHQHKKKPPLGFAVAKPVDDNEELEIEELDDAVATEGKCDRRIYAQHGKLRIVARRYRN